MTARTLALSLALSVLAPLALARAQPPVDAPVMVERRAADLGDGTIARLAVRWGTSTADSGASIAIGDGAPTVLTRGATAASVERGERVTLIAYQTDDARAPFRARVLRREGTTYTLGAEQSLARPGSRSHDAPFAVVIAPIPGAGFAVFFEEVQHDDPTAARTYLFRFDLEGRPAGAGVEIPIPWPLSAAAWNGRGFHLALTYPGTGDGMRLSMVTITPEGQPQQHPDWSSRAGFVTDVHLVTSGDRVIAQYRGGGGGERWIESDVTSIGAWGSSTRRELDRGALAAGESLMVRASGAVERVPPRPDGLASGEAL